jgi:hypothetical protein
MLYAMTGERVALYGTDNMLRGLASQSGNDLSILLTNFSVQTTHEAVAQIYFTNAMEGLYKMTITRIDRISAAKMKDTPTYNLPPAESRTIYAHNDFHFDLFVPEDSVILVQFVTQDA